ncbi:hypothetical protein ANO14919_053470 [Xylariales sp. No.14919]|nr:hypothetical protein ANO14919_053470 [Xylariales sp. No.14919]
MGSISADSLDPLMSDQDNESGVQWAMKRQEGSGRRHIPSWRRITLAELLLIILISFTIALISISLAFKPTDKQCARQLSVYSPAMDAVEYIEYDFDNAFGSQSIYRGPPTDEREAAWHALTALHGFEIPAHQLASLNRSTEGLRRVPEDIGTGFVGFLEVFHQLHCLNTIRQYTWLQAGKYKTPPSKFNTSPVGQRMHVDHCIETVRLALMCFGDLTPVLIREAPETVQAMKADFDSHHKCRNFDKIRKWHDDNWTIP